MPGDKEYTPEEKAALAAEKEKPDDDHDPDIKTMLTEIIAGELSNKIGPLIEKLEAMEDRLSGLEGKKADNDKKMTTIGKEKESTNEKELMNADNDNSKKEISKADIESMEKKLAENPKADDEMSGGESGDDMAEMADIESDEKELAHLKGDRALMPASGENVKSYRLRVAKKHQAESSTWKNADLSKLPASALKIAQNQIKADAEKGYSSPGRYIGQKETAIKTVSEGGQIITTYRGGVSNLSSQRAILAKFNTQ